jgi:hypothetical protein
MDAYLLVDNEAIVIDNNTIEPLRERLLQTSLLYHGFNSIFVVLITTIHSFAFENLVEDSLIEEI